MGNTWEVYVYRVKVIGDLTFTAWEQVYAGEDQDEAMTQADFAREAGARMIKIEWRP